MWRMVSHPSNNDPLFSCGDCLSGKMTKKIKEYDETPDCATEQAGRFDMEYGFVQGKTAIKNESGILITSKNGFNCYLLVVDEFYRHMWVFLFANKTPPITTITSFLANHGTTSGLRHVCTDQGGNWQRV